MVLDTHIFLWYANDDPRLPRHLSDQLRLDTANIYVPSICLWEIMLLYQRGLIQLVTDDPASVFSKVLATSRFTPLALTNEMAILSRTLPFEHNDPADRFIAASAHSLGEPLATLDARLRGLPWLETIP